MSKSTKQDQFKVSRPNDIAGVELRSGVAVKEPYPRHWHEEYQLCFIKDGGGELFYRGTHHNTPQTSLFVVHPGEVHANQTESGCSFSSIYIAPEVFRATACGLEAQAQPFPFFPDPIVLDDELILAYNAVYHALSSSTCTLERESLMLKMLTTLVARHAQISPKHSKVGKEHCGVNRVRDYVHTYYASNVTLGELARVANLSRFHLNRAFTREVGMPPHAFQMQVRVANAKRLIRNGFSFADVAAATGFADQSHFTRQFKKLMKITPGDYREKQQ